MIASGADIKRLENVVIKGGTGENLAGGKGLKRWGEAPSAQQVATDD